MMWDLQPIRGAVLESVMGAPRSLPNPRALDLRAAWTTYFESAPLHVRVGFDAASVLIGLIMPRVLGLGRSLDALDDADRDRVLARVASLPLGQDLVQVAKVVACLVYFSGAGVEDRVRQPRP